jgi:2-polyprenyl-6-hydroxyphenyl methylase/3-demethylubiquinone-9 3-methyltransferase
MSLLSRLVQTQVFLANKLDSLLPAHFILDGYSSFRRDFAPRFFKPGLVVWDIGGGKHPLIDLESKRRLGLTVVGFDLSESDLDRAPEGSYDKAVVANITTFRGAGTADIVVCQALLEHVRDTEAAMRAISSVLKPGGVVLLFVPCRNAPYAWLNRMLPHVLTKVLLRTLNPGGHGGQGFPPYYDRCTPRDFRRIAEGTGMSVIDCRTYYMSSYFNAFFPVYLLWRAWILVIHRIAPEQFAETFSMALRKKAGAAIAIVPDHPPPKRTAAATLGTER